MKLTLKLHNRLEIISAYAPPAVSNDTATPAEDKQTFYNELTDCVKSAPSNNMLIALGDMNARVIEPINKKERQVIGKYALKGNTKPQNLKEETSRDHRNRTRTLPNEGATDRPIEGPAEQSNPSTQDREKTRPSKTESVDRSTDGAIQRSKD